MFLSCNFLSFFSFFIVFGKFEMLFVERLRVFNDLLDIVLKEFGKGRFKSLLLVIFRFLMFNKFLN